MRLLPDRKWIVFFALLCQVVSAALVHVPVASASAVPAEAIGMDCPDHGHGAQTSDRAEPVHAPSGSDTASDSDHGQGCKPGHCKCPCAHVPAVSTEMSLAAATVPHLPVMVVYAPPSITVQPAPFFRPPI